MHTHTLVCIYGMFMYTNMIYVCMCKCGYRYRYIQIFKHEQKGSQICKQTKNFFLFLLGREI